jgi:hypothetical protein
VCLALLTATLPAHANQQRPSSAGKLIAASKLIPAGTGRQVRFRGPLGRRFWLAAGAATLIFSTPHIVAPERASATVPPQGTVATATAPPAQPAPSFADYLTPKYIIPLGIIGGLAVLMYRREIGDFVHSRFGGEEYDDEYADDPEYYGKRGEYHDQYRRRADRGHPYDNHFLEGGTNYVEGEDIDPYADEIDPYADPNFDPYADPNFDPYADPDAHPDTNLYGHPHALPNSGNGRPDPGSQHGSNYADQRQNGGYRPYHADGQRTHRTSNARLQQQRSVVRHPQTGVWRDPANSPPIADSRRYPVVDDAAQRRQAEALNTLREATQFQEPVTQEQPRPRRFFPGYVDSQGRTIEEEEEEIEAARLVQEVHPQNRDIGAHTSSLARMVRQTSFTGDVTLSLENGEVAAVKVIPKDQQARNQQ